MKALAQLNQHGQISTAVENHSILLLSARINTLIYLLSFTKHMLSYILRSFSKLISSLYNIRDIQFLLC